MSFRALKKFLLSDMRMSHIYQPVMIKALLARKGRCSTREIAAAILGGDESQLEYYERHQRDARARAQ